MNRKKGQFGNSYQTLAEAVQRMELKLWWLKFLKRHRGPLNRISDIVRLGCCGDEPYLHFLCTATSPDQALCLRLEYAGQCHSHTDALLDLARIEKVLQCEFGECKIRGGGDTRPQGRYEGTGNLGGRDLKIELDVPWIPCGCRIRHEQVTAWSRGPGVRRYSVVCEV